MQSNIFYDMPDSIQQFIKGEKLIENSTGESLSHVIHIPGKHAYLKISSELISFIPKNEYDILRWLKGKLPVPEVIDYQVNNGCHYMILSEIDGHTINMLVDDYKDDAVRLFASALRMVHSVDISDCPIKYTTDDIIDKIIFCITNRIYGCSAYADNEDTYRLLERYRKAAPAIEPVLIHGDFAMVNVLASNKRVSGIIDVGESGVYCKYRDIVHALDNICYWGFRGDRYRQLFLDEYGLISPDLEKIEFYSQLDYD